jgi:hypothetical protein
MKSPAKPKAKAAKRKVEKCLEEKTKKSAKLDKPQEQLVIEFDILKKKHEALLTQNKANLETISALKKRNSQLENEASKKQEKVSVESQTTMECDSCGYPQMIF